MSGILYRRFYNPNDLQKQTKFLVSGYNGSRIKRLLKPEQSLVGVALLTRAVRKVSVHFEYLQNRSHGLDVTGQPVRGELTVRP